MTTYTYTKTPVAADRLAQEIRDDLAVTVALDHVEVLGDQLSLVFRADLPQADKDALDAVVAAHTGEPMPDGYVQKIEGEVLSLGIKNSHTMQPWGAMKGRLQSSDYAFAVTLTEKSEDGLTFTYNPVEWATPPAIGNYVFQNNFVSRSWITAVDEENHRVTFELPELANGTGHYVIGYYADCKVRDWFPIMYLWGAISACNWTNSHDGRDDFIELSVVDRDDLFLIDDFCLAVFGCTAAEAEPILIAMGFEQNGEYGHWTKYYDESWVLNIAGRQTNAPDGAPGGLLAGLYLRASYFTSKTDDTVTNFYVDYYPTSNT